VNDERLPPQDIAAEQAVLGSMLLSKDAIADVVELLRADDFYQPNHGRIYDAIVALYARGQPADQITVNAELGPEAMRVGGGLYLNDLVRGVSSPASAGWYAARVADRALRRGVIQVGIRTVQRGYSEDDDTDAIVDAAQAEIMAVRDGSTADTVRAGDLLGDALGRIEEAAANGGRMGVPTGIRDLDDLTRGLHPGQLVIIAARPGVGKTALGLGAALHAAIRADVPTAMFSLEMSTSELVDRALSHETRVPLNRIRSGQLTDDDWTRIGTRSGRIADAPLFIDDSAVTAAEIIAKARRMRAQNGLGLVIVDYLQLMTSGKRVESRQVEVAEFSRSLKLLAKDLGVPVVALSQLNRNSEMRAEKRPHLSDLRESGAIEQDSDVVLLLHREDMTNPETARAGEADIIVAKHRNGPTGTITVTYQAHCTRFTDRASQAWSPSAAAGVA
jgi:replicative DNA helicase